MMRIIATKSAVTALAVVLAGHCTATSADTEEPPLAFASVQPDTFGIAGSLSNAWADFDKDGDLDFAVSINGGGIRLYRNDGGAFTNVGAEMGLPFADGQIRGLSWGDFDDDGWLDLFAGSASPDEPSALFRNEAGEGFSDVAAEVGLTVPGRSSRQNNWIDLDGDGDLDFYAADRIGKNKLYRNDLGVFTQTHSDTPPTIFRATVGACWLDYDEDGDLDLFLANQSGNSDALFRNDGGAFTDVAPALGMDRPGRDPSEGSVGCAVGDYDNDGHLDIFVPSYGHNVLWQNSGEGGFSEQAEQMGVGVENHAVGASWGDYDNDGWIDLFVTSYEGPRGEQVPVNALFHNEGGAGFVNVIDEYPLLNSGDHGVEWIDFDGDGAIDLQVLRGYGPVGGHFLFRNAMPKALAQHSLGVLVEGNMPGTEVRLYHSNGSILATRQVSTGGGYNAQSVVPVHFGLATDRPVTVAVTWITGEGRKTLSYEDIDPRDYSGGVFTIAPPHGGSF